MNHHIRKKWGLPGLLLVLSLSGCDNGTHGGDHTDIIAQTYDVTVNSTGEGEVSPTTNSVSTGDLSTFSVVPYDGYRIHSVSVTDGECPLKNVTINSIDDGLVNYTVGPVSSDCTVNVTFEQSTSPTQPARLRNVVSMTVSPNDGSGGIIQLSESGEPVTSTNFYLAPGESQTFWVEANENYHLKDISVDDPEHCSIAVALISDEAYSVKSILGKCEVTVDFEKVRAPLDPLAPQPLGPLEYYNITFEEVVGDGKVSINPLPIRVPKGKSFDFSVTPVEQSRIGEVSGYGCSVSTTTDIDPYSTSYYTSEPVESDCTITVEAEKYYTVTISHRSEGTINNIQVLDKDGNPIVEPLGSITRESIDAIHKIKMHSDQYVTFEAQSDSGYIRSYASTLECGLDSSNGVYKTNQITRDCNYYIDFTENCNGKPFTSTEDIQTLLDNPDDGKGTTIVLNDATLRKAVTNTSGNSGTEYTGLLSEGRNITFDTSCVTDMSVIFYNAAAFNEDISQWDVSSVTTMAAMFYNANSFNKDVSNWNTSRVTDMSYMFYNANSFNKDVSNWNTSKVTDMSYMFNYAIDFNKDISNWKTFSVTNMSAMFMGARSFNVDIGGWNVSNVRNMSSMFQSAATFKADIGDWKTSRVTNMSYMFSHATHFNADISDWETSSVTNMSNMFEGTTFFEADISNWNTSNVTDMSNMFSHATFNKDISKWDVSNVTDMNSMFSYAIDFNADISKWDVSSVTDMSSMFSYATDFNRSISRWCVSEIEIQPDDFNTNSAFASQSSFQPQWGKCPLRLLE
ncbi:BspA family leucine-rich repeat surface protein [Vibrio sagamiensis]|uniref:Lipoprotein n=1 Tax=Vibrio sagamiensis NBRC 104589 TaxID=1219064 RepID=A0A511QJU3_9VIBR|nr:BspA family leucine-rich repeat surface protein [Vibrio sagamiensis]GEM77593.1 hypothetical protein VSA01S_37050 [Vibrio sagamiensis NBRC 104589]